jgi:hypothetical protein
MVQEHSFLGWDDENPYHHLCEFEQVCSCVKISSMTHEISSGSVPPLSNRVGEGIVHKRRKKHEWILEWSSRPVLLAFFPLSRVYALRAEILTFRQSEKESISAAWARLSSLAQSGPDLSLPNHLLLQHLYTGLSKENARYLDITAGGSFTHKTPAEGSKIHDKIMENYGRTAWFNLA